MIMPVLSVRDVDASIAFYTDKLGFQKSMALEGPDGKTAWAIVSLGAASVGLGRNEVDKPGQGMDLMIYVPDDTDIDDYYKTVQGKGVTLESEIKTEYWGDRFFALKDTDGYSLSLCKTIHEADMDYAAKVMSGEAESSS